MKHKFFSIIVSLLCLLSITITSAYALRAQSNIIVVTTTIQAAVDAANSGDTVRVPPGMYYENVFVTKDNITIEGSIGAIMDGTGLSGTSGITVRSLTPLARINGFRLTGLQVQNYSRNGVILVRVDNYQIDHGVYVDNDAYGIFPIRSSHGVIEFNHVSGSDDTGIYIGQSSDAVIRKNQVTDCTVGINVEVSSNITVQDNKVMDNTIGTAALVLPGLSVTETTNIQINGNLFMRNNRPNPMTDPTDILSQLPSGIGLLVFGADHVTVMDNKISDNNSAGIAVIQVPPALAALDPRINPLPDHNEISKNVVLSNGSNPDPKIAPFPPSDLIWDVSGTNNCWSDNVSKTSFPSSLPDCP
ncbi:MAG TPA: parallel beta-helix domain-containing protein [Anaerolineales bacterium]|nr:parallel beta-helix domain-containing protein [Anaerolineales bacterium]